MGPNLARLFEEAEKKPYEIHDGRTVSTSAAAAKVLRDTLLRNHGEALIEALSDFDKWYGMKGWDKRELDLTDRISKLLAQLESEAQP